jgi:hypothetical protein
LEAYLKPPEESHTANWFRAPTDAAKLSSAVAGVVEDMEPTAGPSLGESPRGLHRTADVIPAMDEDARDAVEHGSVADKLVVLEEGGVPPVVRDQAREPEAEFRVFETRVGTMAGGEGNVSVFPGAPLPRRVFAHGGVSVEEQRCISIDRPEVP